jgi:capsule polysaccharide export protein KpsE/RkpR
MKPACESAQSDFAAISSRETRNRITVLRQVADQLVRGDRLVALIAEKSRRDGRRIRQQEIADAADVQLRTVQIWLSSFTPHSETGEIRPGRGIDWENAVKLAEFFGADPESLVTRPEEPLPAGATNEDVASLQDDVRGLAAQLHRVESLLNLLLGHFELQAEADALRQELSAERESSHAADQRQAAA